MNKKKTTSACSIGVRDWVLCSALHADAVSVWCGGEAGANRSLYRHIYFSMKLMTHTKYSELYSMLLTPQSFSRRNYK